MDTIIIGGGQAGLAASYHLTQRGREHLVLEQAGRAAESWRKRWDSFTLITPNWMNRLPGAEYHGDEPDAFMPRDQVVAYIEAYAQRFALPVRYGIRVSAVEPIENGYRVRATDVDFEARSVVIATGSNQRPKVPAFSVNLPAAIRQIHSSQYRNPESLPAGAVLVVGSAQSGCQIAEELYQSGRKVYLSVSGAGRIPRRYRGKDLTEWFYATGFAEMTVDKLPSPQAKFAAKPHSTGKNGGHTINLHQFARDGVVLLGRLQEVQGARIILAPDLRENLAKADKFSADFRQGVDNYLTQNGLEAPIDSVPELRDGYAAEQILEIDLELAGIRCVVWATGYSFDFGWVKLPAFDDDGYPVQQRGVTDFPGLYFVGLGYMHTFQSDLLAGVGDDAAHVVAHLAARRLSGGAKLPARLDTADAARG